jgi:hypothetical protein
MTDKFTSDVLKDNEQAVAYSLQQKNYVQAFLLVHALIESLLRVFLSKKDESLRFCDLKRFRLEYSGNGITTMLKPAAYIRQSHLGVSAL